MTDELFKILGLFMVYCVALAIAVWLALVGVAVVFD